MPTSYMRHGDIFIYKNDLPDDLRLDGDLAIDTEAMGLSHARDRLCVVQISNGDGLAHLVQFDKNCNYCAPNLSRVLMNESIIKIFHYARFDLASIGKWLGIWPQNVYCTKLASRLSRSYTNSHSLRDLCYDILGVKISKAQQTSDWGAQKLTAMQIEYAASDVLYLHRLRTKLDELLNREGRMDLAKRCFAFLPTRAELDVVGWPEFDIFQHGS